MTGRGRARYEDVIADLWSAVWRLCEGLASLEVVLESGDKDQAEGQATEQATSNGPHNWDVDDCIDHEVEVLMEAGPMMAMMSPVDSGRPSSPTPVTPRPTWNTLASEFSMSDNDVGVPHHEVLDPVEVRPISDDEDDAADDAAIVHGEVHYETDTVARLETETKEPHFLPLAPGQNDGSANVVHFST